MLNLDVECKGLVASDTALVVDILAAQYERAREAGDRRAMERARSLARQTDVLAPWLARVGGWAR